MWRKTVEPKKLVENRSQTKSRDVKTWQSWREKKPADDLEIKLSVSIWQAMCKWYNLALYGNTFRINGWLFIFQSCLCLSEYSGGACSIEQTFVVSLKICIPNLKTGWNISLLYRLLCLLMNFFNFFRCTASWIAFFCFSSAGVFCNRCRIYIQCEVEFAIKMIGSGTDVRLPYRLLCYWFKIKNIAEAKFLDGLRGKNRCLEMSRNHMEYLPAPILY